MRKSLGRVREKIKEGGETFDPEGIRALLAVAPGG